MTPCWLGEGFIAALRAWLGSHLRSGAGRTKERGRRGSPSLIRKEVNRTKRLRGFWLLDSQEQMTDCLRLGEHRAVEVNLGEDTERWLAGMGPTVFCRDDTDHR